MSTTQESVAIEIVLRGTDEYPHDTATPSMTTPASSEHSPQPAQSTLTPPITADNKPNKGTSLHKQHKSGDINEEYIPNERFKDYLDRLQGCAENSEGFDVYQMLAFRRMEHKFEAAKGDTSPLSCCEKAKAVFENKYTQTKAMVLVIGLLQTFGITLILAEVVLVYFFPQWYDVAADDAADFECEIGAEYWDEPSEVAYKLLAFLFATMISINLGKAIHTIRTNGFNSVLEEKVDGKPVGLRSADLSRVKVVDPAMLQIGVLINMYALVLAVFGSFFMIYASEDGADSLDMVFNALALFFLIELDDLLVQDEDYDDVKDFLDDYIKKGAYQGKLWRVERESTEASHCCRPSCFKHFKAFSEALQLMIKVFVYFAAVVGPFLVSLCW